MSDLTSLTLAEARDAVRSKRLSSRELTEAHLAAMEAARPLNAFITETPDRALAMADAADARLARGEAGPLVVLLDQPVHLPLPHVVRVLVHLLEYGPAKGGIMNSEG